MMYPNGSIQFGKKLWVPSGEARDRVLEKVHRLALSIHPGNARCTVA